MIIDLILSFVRDGTRLLVELSRKAVVLFGVLGSLEFQSLEIPLLGFELLDALLECYDVFFARRLCLSE